MSLLNVTGSKLRAIHRGLRRRGSVSISLREYARLVGFKPTLAAGTHADLDWLGAEARAFMARKGMRP